MKCSKNDEFNPCVNEGRKRFSWAFPVQSVHVSNHKKLWWINRRSTTIKLSDVTLLQFYRSFRPWILCYLLYLFLLWFLRLDSFTALARTTKSREPTQKSYEEKKKTNQPITMRFRVCLVWTVTWWNHMGKNSIKRCVVIGGMVIRPVMSNNCCDESNNGMSVKWYRPSPENTDRLNQKKW